MARRRGSYPVRSTRRGVGWEEGPGGHAVTQLTTTGSTILNAGAQSQLDDITLMRTRGGAHIFLNGAATGAGAGFHGAIGIGIVTSEAFAIGITAIPVPITNLDWDGWLYHSFFDVHVGSSAPAGPIDSASSSVRLDVDSKAMRKLTGGDTIYAAVQVEEAGTAVVDIYFESRLLIKAP